MSTNVSDETQQAKRREGQDWLLENFVTLVNLHEGSFSVVLAVSGVVISGLLIGVREYFSEFGKLYASYVKEADPKLYQQLVERYNELGISSYKRIKELYDEDPNKAFEKLVFLHLKDARFIQGRHLLPNNQGLLWRGRLSEVSGFSIAALSDVPTE